jgi:hypothetical protein
MAVGCGGPEVVEVGYNGETLACFRSRRSSTTPITHDTGILVPLGARRAARVTRRPADFRLPPRRRERRRALTAAKLVTPHRRSVWPARSAPAPWDRASPPRGRCAFSHKSGVLPNTRARMRAVAAVTLRRLLQSSLTCLRRTPMASVTAPWVRSRGCMNSSSRISPTVAGLRFVVSMARLSVAVVVEIDVCRLAPAAVVDVECHLSSTRVTRRAVNARTSAEAARSRLLCWL